ncbi:GNAT family N-acetyltransferase [Oceaniglobus roseus]|uniref:GNAT family N-acetyltransferase n=1 Tax=Oceaniglobus roseus TaxID=1737570 RepID=UPI000C7EF853|nr:GNAT family N-acetyltransferase [Kandeliimicrobium roseum]
MAEETLTIRTATAADLAAVDSLLSASYPALLRKDYPPSVMVTAVPLIARAQPRLLASGSYYVVCTAEGEVAAAGGWTWTSPAGGLGPRDMAHVRHVVTDHRRVRQGLGRALLSHAMDEARRAGVGQLDCLSTLTAQPFYAALGFRSLGPVDIRLAPGILFPAMRMHRRL